MLWFARWNGWQDVDEGGGGIITPTNRCTLASKLMLSGAALILIVGVILTLMTVSSGMNMQLYKPFILTVLGILLIIVGPMIACRLLLNAYDRRLLRNQQRLVSISGSRNYQERMISASI
jgi:hypothetical protein